MTDNSKLDALNETIAAAPPVMVASAGKDAEKKEESDFPFAVAVTDVYEGPLDLLLDLIRKQDIDIYDIPIAKITGQFLAYIENLKQSDIDGAEIGRAHV